jgi:hypothetical protein
MKASAYVPKRFLAPLRWIFRARGHKWLKVINRLGGDEIFSSLLWEVVSLTFRSNTSKIKNEELRRLVQGKYKLLHSLPEGELRKRINHLIHERYPENTISTFDFRDYLAQKLCPIRYFVDTQNKTDPRGKHDHASAKKILLKKDGVFENLLLVMEWLRRNPSN